MSDSQTDATVTVSVRMPTALAETLAVRAEGNERSRSREIVSILKAATGARVTEAMLRTNPVDAVQVAAMENQRRANQLPHDFKPQRGNTLKCDVCGGKGRDHV